MGASHYSEYLVFTIDDTSEEGYRASIDSMEQWLVDLELANMVYSEVNNGGFAQYFINYAGIGAVEASAGLERIGLPELNAITKEAMDRIPGGFVRDKDERTSRLMAMAGLADGDDSAFFQKKLFNDLDARFFASQEHGEFEERMLAYAEEFGECEEWE